MFDLHAMNLAFGSEIFLIVAGLSGVLAGALWGDKFNGLSFRFGAVSLLIAAIWVALAPEGAVAFGGH